MDVCHGWTLLVWHPHHSCHSLAFLLPEQAFWVVPDEILPVHSGDRPTGKKRRFWFRGAFKAARALNPAVPAGCGASPGTRGRKGLWPYRAAPKPAQILAPAVLQLCGKSPLETDPPVGRRSPSQDIPACPPTHLLPPSIPLLHWPREHKTLEKRERVLLTWPQFPTCARLLCRNQTCHYEQETVAQPLPPAAPRLMVWGQGPRKKAPLQGGKAYPNSRPLCRPADPHLQMYIHSLESSPGRRDCYWFWKPGRNINPLLEMFKLWCTEIC